jgi:hypothetical protein
MSIIFRTHFSVKNRDYDSGIITFFSGILKISKIAIPNKNAKFVCEVRSKAPSNNLEN